MLTPAELEEAILAHVREAYPNMQVRVVDREGPDGAVREVHFLEEMFTALYPLQRYNYIVHLFPAEFYDEHLAETEWYELAPGESPEELRYPDTERLEEIAPAVLERLEQAGFFTQLDELFTPAGAGRDPAVCYGDFRHTQALLRSLGFTEEEVWDACHIMMLREGYCDCEILTKVLEESRTGAALGTSTEEDHEHDDHHEGHGHVGHPRSGA